MAVLLGLTGGTGDVAVAVGAGALGVGDAVGSGLPLQPDKVTSKASAAQPIRLGSQDLTITPYPLPAGPIGPRWSKPPHNLTGGCILSAATGHGQSVDRIDWSGWRRRRGVGVLY